MPLKKLGQDVSTGSQTNIPNSSIGNIDAPTTVINKEPVFGQRREKISLHPNVALLKHPEHETLIKPHGGNFKFIVDCKCGWQGRAVDKNGADIIAKDHVLLHVNKDKV